MTAMDVLAKLQPRWKGAQAANPEALAAGFEQRFAGPLPEDYRAFLVSAGRGVGLGTNQVAPLAKRGAKRKGAVALDFLYGLDDKRPNLVSENAKYQGRFPPGLVTIGTSGADQVLLDVAGLAPGSVHVWDHEGEVDRTGKPVASFANMVLLAHSFTELLERTELVAEEENKPGDVVSMTLKFKLPNQR